MGGGASAHDTHFQNENTTDDGSESGEDGDPHLISLSNKMVERLVEDAAVAGGEAAATTTSMSRCTLETQFDARDSVLSEKLRASVERLVEDAAVAGGAAAATTTSLSRCTLETQLDARDSVLSEKLRALDESHSEKVGLTMEELKSVAKRIELRTAHMQKDNVKPVCQDCAERVIDCYESCDRVTNAAKCSEEVVAFSKCVQETSVSRLRSRTVKDALEAARRTRHVAQARHHALKDLSIPLPEVPS